MVDDARIRKTKIKARGVLPGSWPSCSPSPATPYIMFEDTVNQQ